MNQSLFVVVPVLNEAANMARLTESFHVIQREYQGIFQVRFLLIDDGSTDQTVELARKLDTDLDLTILQHPQNLGPGRAFSTAFEHLSAHIREEDWIVTMEGDNTSRIELLRQMFHRAEEGYDVIFASPYSYGGSIVNTSTLRIVLSTVANTFVKSFLDIQGLFTVSSFFRLYQGKTIKKLQTHYGPSIVEFCGFECMLEMLMKMIYIETSISEVPMILDTKLRSGKSKMKIFKTILGYLQLLSYKTKWRLMAGKNL
jgi:dolichol-phosphate mannosyltransferase